MPESLHGREFLAFGLDTPRWRAATEGRFPPAFGNERVQVEPDSATAVWDVEAGVVVGVMVTADHHDEGTDVSRRAYESGELAKVRRGYAAP